MPRISKKLASAVISVFALVLSDVFGIHLEPGVLEAIETIVVGYLVAQGGVDIALAAKGDSPSQLAQRREVESLNEPAFPPGPEDAPWPQ